MLWKLESIDWTLRTFPAGRIDSARCAAAQRFFTARRLWSWTAREKSSLADTHAKKLHDDCIFHERKIGETFAVRGIPCSEFTCKFMREAPLMKQARRQFAKDARAQIFLRILTATNSPRPPSDFQMQIALSFLLLFTAARRKSERPRDFRANIGPHDISAFRSPRPNWLPISDINFSGS